MEPGNRWARPAIGLARSRVHIETIVSVNKKREGAIVKKAMIFPAAAFLVFFLISLSAIGQENTGTAASTSDDELAPVRAIRESIRKRLEYPVEQLDVDLIMEGYDFFGSTPRFVRWDSDGSRFWFQWKRWNETEQSTFEYSTETKHLKKLSKSEAELIPSSRAVWDLSHRRAAWQVRESILLYDGEDKSTAALLKGLAGLRPVAFTGKADFVVLRYRDNLLAVRVENNREGPLVRQLTNIRPGQPPKDEPPTKGQRWLEQQQLELFEVLNRRYQRSEEDKKRVKSLTPSPLYLGGWKIDALIPSPDLKHVAIFQRRDTPKDKRTKVPNYVTNSGYTEEISSRIKVGDDLDSTRLGIIEVATGRVGWVDFNLGERKIFVGNARWNPDGSCLLTGARAADNKDCWLFIVEPVEEEGDDGGQESSFKDSDTQQQDAGEQEQRKSTPETLALKATLLIQEHDDAWVHRSLLRWSGWLPDGKMVYFVSERTGKTQLYAVPVSGGEVQALTEGDFEIFSPRLTPDRKAFVFEASIPSPFEVQTYLLPLEGGKPQPLTGGMGRASGIPSPDGKLLVLVASNRNKPWELYIKRFGEPGVGEQVTDSPSPAFKSYRWTEPKIVRFGAEDGAEVPARLYRPEKKHTQCPAVIFVHGAGYMQNVHNWWSPYAREYCFHHLLMERGYTVLDIDYRGSAGYGRDWRVGIYRHMGGKDLSDQVDGVRYLVEQHGIDPGRIGIYGGSYGGFITLMALFTAPEHFTAGAALRPVTDWAAYAHAYAANILNTPAEDSEAYERSSPIYFAEGLEDPLLICHGVIDTNVHFQGVVRLAQRLMELRKENWEVAIYPVEGHGFKEPSSWADEYKRILKLFEENLKK